MARNQESIMYMREEKKRLFAIGSSPGLLDSSGACDVNGEEGTVYQQLGSQRLHYTYNVVLQFPIVGLLDDCSVFDK